MQYGLPGAPREFLRAVMRRPPVRSPEAAVAAVLRLAVGLVLLRAATAKVTGFAGFRQTVAGLGVPRRIVPAAAGVFVTAEGCLALWLLSGWVAGAAAIGCLLFLTGLALVSVYALVTGRSVPCSCFGASDRSLGGQTLLLSGPLLAAQLAYLLIGFTAGGFRAVRYSELPIAFALALILIVVVRGIAVGPAFVMIVRHRRRLAAAMEAEAHAARRAR
jgi:hypothetical protein